MQSELLSLAAEDSALWRLVRGLRVARRLNLTGADSSANVVDGECIYLVPCTSSRPRSEDWPLER